ncbi:hypothetical protein [Streptomyces sp. TE5632]
MPPAAGAWLDTPGPNGRSARTSPPPGDRVNLLRSTDLVVHLHEIRPSRPLPRD